MIHLLQTFKSIVPGRSVPLLDLLWLGHPSYIREKINDAIDYSSNT